MSLRVINLRGTPPPFEPVLPRPQNPGADVYDAVAEVVRRVRQEGDAAIIEFTQKFDAVDVSGPLTAGRACGSRPPRSAPR